MSTQTTAVHAPSPLKRTGAPRFTDEELQLVKRAAIVEDRDVANLVRVATLQYARDVLARDRLAPR